MLTFINKEILALNCFICCLRSAGGYLIVSIPDICLFYFKKENKCKLTPKGVAAQLSQLLVLTYTYCTV